MTGTARRLALLRQRMAAGVPALLVTDGVNRRYLSGFTGSSGWLLVTAGEAWLITDFRYEEQAQAEAAGWTVVVYRAPDRLETALARLLGERRVTALGFDPDALTVSAHRALAEALPGVELRPAPRLVTALRAVKDEAELALIRRAMAQAEEAFARLLPEVRPGRSERELALELEFLMRRLGADGAAFDFIVASGPRSSLPHGQPTDRRLQAGDLVTFDFGARFAGYHSDITRTVVVGRADERQREVYEVVRAAQAAALAAVREGAKAEDVDRAARDVIAAAGYGERFGHSTGHGVGLEVHEYPTLAPRRDDLLVAGMVVTVEPGVYIPGWGGVRIEDTVVVTPSGCEVLCRTPKELLCV